MLEPALVSFVCALLVALVFQTVMFFVAREVKRDDLVDVGWGTGFIFVVWIVAIAHTSKGFELSLGALIALILITIWGTRLSYHILTRFAQKDEDRRYVEMKKDWKMPFLRSYVQIFLLQGLFMAIIALPAVMMIRNSASEFMPLIALAIGVWSAGFMFQVWGDIELTKHINKRKKGLLQSGIWSYTRHPNYFGEIMMWWGIWIIALGSLTLGNTLIALVGPLLITLLIKYVSGVPMLEKNWKEKYGEEFDEYAKKTPVLVPHLTRGQRKRMMGEE